MSGTNTCEGCTHYEDRKCQLKNATPEISISGYPIPIDGCGMNKGVSYAEWRYYMGILKSF